ncbi:hypothetical protein [Aeromicrobium sp. 179-A 4D2 NHS]|uniref:hypothetical protein n=1 Tax=Aeromicrobium sp. 179-A 4D2 NHS TaxID=3142375 RepID=UPI0039A1B30F
MTDPTSDTFPDWAPVRGEFDPPSGWYPFGTHAGWDTGEVPVMEFSEQTDDAGMPLWERPFARPLISDVRAVAAAIYASNPDFDAAGAAHGYDDIEVMDSDLRKLASSQAVAALHAFGVTDVDVQTGEAVARVGAWVEFDRRNQPDRPEDQPLGIAYERYPVTRRDLDTLVNAVAR